MSEVRQQAPSRARILVVDDEPGMLRAVERVLGAEYSIASAASAAEALQAAQSQRLDVVLSDISMPGMDGFELMQHMPPQEPPADFILMTGLAEPDAALVRAIRQRAFYFLQKPFDREVLRALISRCVELRQLREARRQNAARIQRELADARRLQQTLLQPGTLELAQLTIHARLEPCSELAGDLYDYAVLPDGRVGFLVADITGHGVSAAMLTAGVIAAFRAAAVHEIDPLAVVRATYDQMQSFPPGRFVTLLAGRIDPSTGEIAYINAGHPPGFLLGVDGACGSLDCGGPIVSSAFARDEWQIETALLRSGERLLLVTDGLIEVFGSSGMFGIGRLRETAVQLLSHPGGEIVAGVFAAVRAYSLSPSIGDDLTAMLISRR